METNFADFLKETKFCDFSNPEVQKLAKEIAKNYKSNKEIAVSAFYWVRDNILYRVGLWQRKASETIKEREGTCTNKANLLVALLRANNIPAGYGIMKVYGQEYFSEIATPSLRKFIGKISTHIYALVYLENKWIKCDPSDDKKLCENTFYFNPTTRLVEWDGRKDATMNFDKRTIIEDDYPVDNIDCYMEKKSKNARGIQLKVANIFIKFARQNKKIVKNGEEFELIFKNYLKKNYPLFFYSFILASFYRDLKSKFRNEKRT
jgi:hypothetical protein